ncbi:hypothetical protein [Rhodococcus sp. UNC363MFTsu5.1]|uniref:hypothetical protein n=1 Tax=Rhodococcus sp. UNC363MFTsu5.1 TaxID=1449069 RepID=UPI0012DE6A01|nr:hypothetical protein [Rhodococcus sp. UNC363MFTsu5.1]
MAIQVHFALFHCDDTEDLGSNGDECVLYWNGDDRIWSGKMKGGRTRNTDCFKLFPSSNSALVTLMEEDSPDPDDRLGDHTIRKDELGQGWHRAHFRSDDTAKYWLDYEVFQG